MDEKSLSKFFDWFDLQKDEVMQLNAYDVFRKKKQYAVTRHVRTLNEVLEFCRKYPDMFLLAGLNPRPPDFLGTRKDAREEDIKRIKHLLFDVEPRHKKGESVSEKELSLARRFVTNHLKPNLGPSKLCLSGNGFHVLVAIPPINPARHKLFKRKLETFWRNIINDDLKDEIERYSIRIDPTFDYIRRVKIYGTKKQYEGSRFSKWLDGSSKALNQDLLKRILSTKPVTIEKPISRPEVRALSTVEAAYEDLKECPAYYMILKEPNSRQWQDREFLVKYLKYFLGLGFDEIKELITRYNGWTDFNPEITEKKIKAHFIDGSYATKVKTYVRKKTLMKFRLCSDNCKVCIYDKEKWNVRQSRNKNQSQP
jgi:hypothetical protein